MSVYKKMKPYVPGMGGILILAFLLIIGSSVALIAEYQAIYLFLKKILVASGLEGLSHLVTILCLCALAYTVINFIGCMATHRIAFRLEANLKKPVWMPFWRHPRPFLTSIHPGKFARCWTTIQP